MIAPQNKKEVMSARWNDTEQGAISNAKTETDGFIIAEEFEFIQRGKKKRKEEFVVDFLKNF